MNYIISPRHAVRYAWSGPVASQLLQAQPNPLPLKSYLVCFILFDLVFIIMGRWCHHTRSAFQPRKRVCGLRLFPWSEYIVARAADTMDSTTAIFTLFIVNLFQYLESNDGFVMIIIIYSRATYYCL